MGEGLDKVGKELIGVVGPELAKLLGKQMEQLPDMICPIPSDDEVNKAVGENASPKEAYRKGHQIGWGKGVLMMGCLILVGAVIINVAKAPSSYKIH